MNKDQLHTKLVNSMFAGEGMNDEFVSVLRERRKFNGEKPQKLIVMLGDKKKWEGEI